MFVLHIKRERIKPLEHSLCYISPLVKVFWASDKGALEELSARVSVIEIEEEEKKSFSFSRVFPLFSFDLIAAIRAIKWNQLSSNLDKSFLDEDTSLKKKNKHKNPN